MRQAHSRRLARFVVLLAAASMPSCIPHLPVPEGSEPPAAGRRPPPPPGPPPREQLRALGVRFRPWSAPAGRVGAGTSCAVEDGVVLLRGATGVHYSKPPRVSAAFAVRLARFEALAQQQARATFGRRLARIEHLGTYVCRSIAGAPGVASEHAFGNAIDISGFVLDGGRRVTIGRHFVRGGAPANTPAGQFLASLMRQVQEERLFGAVLTPDFDRRHADHLHLDGRRRGWWRRWWS